MGTATAQFDGYYGRSQITDHKGGSVVAGAYFFDSALGSPVGGGAKSVVAGGPRISAKIGFRASAQI